MDNNNDTNQVTSSSEDGVNGGSGSSEQDEQGSNESDEYSDSDNNKKQSSGVSSDDYEDYSRLPPLPQNPADTKGSSSKEPTFPLKLHMILSNPAHEGEFFLSNIKQPLIGSQLRFLNVENWSMARSLSLDK